MKKIAIVTGASSGMGREFVRQLAERYPVLDEIWAVARREERLLELQKETGNVRIRAFSLDLKEEESFRNIAECLRRESPGVRILVNGSGIGISGDFMDLSEQEISDMVAVNCGALTKMTYLVLPYMKKGAMIYQFASAAAFSPQPGFAVYAAAKAYVLRFSTALRQELKKKGIRVTAVCPGPVKTEFLEKAYGKQEMSFYKKLVIADCKKVVSRAIEDGKKGRAVSVYGGTMKFLRIISRLLPEEVLAGFFRG